MFVCVPVYVCGNARIHYVICSCILAPYIYDFLLLTSLMALRLELIPLELHRLQLGFRLGYDLR